jgi:DNA-binding HxlR family transcriptional regulator
MITLSDLTDKKWAIRSLAMMSELRGVRFVHLVRSLGASQGGVKACLDFLLDQGLIVRNPGYGHPLRPEYILTEKGRPVAEMCESVDEALVEAGARAASQQKWVLPVLHTIDRGSDRFSLIRAGTPGTADRTAALAL